MSDRVDAVEAAAWSTPGATAAQPTRSGGGAEDLADGATAGSGAPGRLAADAPLPPAPARLGPLTVADILDGAFEAITSRPRELLTLVAAVVLPAQVLSALVLREVFADDSLAADAESGFAVAWAGSPSQWFAMTALGLVSLTLVCAAMGPWLLDWIDGVRRPTSTYLLGALRKSPVLVAATVLVHLAEAIGAIALVIGAYPVMCLFHLVTPIIAVEGGGPLRALRRSASLTWSRFSTSLALPGMVALIGGIVGLLLGFLGEFVSGLLSEDLRWVVFGVTQLGGQLLTVPFTAGVAILTYFDLRSRREAFDLDRRAHTEFGSDVGGAAS